MAAAAATYAWNILVEKSDVPIGLENGLEGKESQLSLVYHRQVAPLECQRVLVFSHLDMGIRGRARNREIRCQSKPSHLWGRWCMEATSCLK